MTHDKLLAKIEDMYEFAGMNGATTSVYPALRAVVELPKPEPLDERGDVCLTCCPDLLVLYPCPTIQAIEKELE